MKADESWPVLAQSRNSKGLRDKDFSMASMLFAPNQCSGYGTGVSFGTRSLVWVLQF